MSGIEGLLSQPGLEAVFVPSRPARAGAMAFWNPTRSPSTFTDTLELVLPAASVVRQRTTPVTRLPIAAVLDGLVDLPSDAPCGPSVHTWARAARGALHLIARGRLLPMVDEDGVDGWRLGPLDPGDLEAREALADGLPPAGHATAIAGSAPRRISSPRWLMARYWDAIADAYVRTGAAPVEAGHTAFASTEPTSVRLVTPGADHKRGRADVGQWLTSTASSIAWSSGSDSSSRGIAGTSSGSRISSAKCIVDIASAPPQLETAPASPTNVRSALDTLKIRGLVRYSKWLKKSSHVHRKVKSATVTSAGPASGTMIRRKTPACPHPSIIAASSSSLGSVRMNCTSSVRGSTSPVCATPLTVTLISTLTPLDRCGAVVGVLNRCGGSAR